MKFLQGWRTLLSALVWIGVVTVALVTGHDLRPIAEGVAQSLGWTTPSGPDWAFYLMAANTALATWGAGSRLWAAWKQWHAGASPDEVLRLPGYVKLAQAEGKLGKGAYSSALKD